MPHNLWGIFIDIFMDLNKYISQAIINKLINFTAILLQNTHFVHLNYTVC